MKIGVPIWAGRVSPVFDTAETLLVVNVDGGRQVSRERVGLPKGPLHDRVNRLAASEIDVLLCGAISRPLYDMLVAAGIDVNPFLSGEVDALLESALQRGTIDRRFLMPGCGGRGRRRRSGRHRARGKGKVST